MNKALKDCKMHYCPGCGHTTVHKIVCDVIDELGLRREP
jgi:2-oxoglutarate ferredoxin oxidoreductase subunit beta